MFCKHYSDGVLNVEKVGGGSSVGGLLDELAPKCDLIVPFRNAIK